MPFRRVLRTLVARQKAVKNDQVDHSELVTRLSRSLGAVGAIFPFRARCLERSLALFALLTLKRVPDCALQIGVTLYGFRAHAWVTHRGEPVNERPDDVKEFVPFLLS
jgi:hypothetical protein